MNDIKTIRVALELLRSFEENHCDDGEFKSTEALAALVRLEQRIDAGTETTASEKNAPTYIDTVCTTCMRYFLRDEARHEEIKCPACNSAAVLGVGKVRE